jgi:hypothetical protein
MAELTNLSEADVLALAKAADEGTEPAPTLSQVEAVTETKEKASGDISETTRDSRNHRNQIHVR